MNTKIDKIHARYILDSRANPTVEAEITLEDGSFGRAAVPSGASTGKLEAYELRDSDESYLGKGVSKAVDNINTKIQDLIIGKDSGDQANIDSLMKELDGSENKSNLGANAILAVSIANIKAYSASSKKQAYEVLPNLYGPASLPIPFLNILNGGAHADNKVDIQEFMIVPHGFERFDYSIKAGVEIYHTLKNLLKDKNLSTNVGDEGGFAPDFDSSSEVIEAILLSIEKAGYKVGEEVSIALDAAASEFYKDEKYMIEGQELSSSQMVDYLYDLTEKYPIISIEDGLAEDDWEGWRLLTEKIGEGIQLVGDDLFVTQEKILQEGIDKGIANSILIKLNQVGTLTETLDTMNLAKDNNYSSIVSHRSGETEDTFISHLVVGTSSGQIKTGAPARSERTAKYNELLRIGETVGLDAFNNRWKK
tara:strand:- start:86 stop:1351 length:1266 start_codon:yes stop_codon:yes gene_type:complete